MFTPPTKAQTAFYDAEAREQAWALYHLNFPENARGLGPWENEQISFSDKRAGSIFGLGLVDNPLNETDAERRRDVAHHRNRVRAQVRDAFNAGKTWDELASMLGGENAAYVAKDLGVHYRVAYTTQPDAIVSAPSSNTPQEQAKGLASLVISPLAYALGWRL